MPKLTQAQQEALDALAMLSLESRAAEEGTLDGHLVITFRSREADQGLKVSSMVLDPQAPLTQEEADRTDFETFTGARVNALMFAKDASKLVVRFSGPAGVLLHGLAQMAVKGNPAEQICAALVVTRLLPQCDAYTKALREVPLPPMLRQMRGEDGRLKTLSMDMMCKLLGLPGRVHFVQGTTGVDSFEELDAAISEMAGQDAGPDSGVGTKGGAA